MKWFRGIGRSLSPPNGTHVDMLQPTDINNRTLRFVVTVCLPIALFFSKTLSHSILTGNSLANMASVDYVFKTVNYGTQTVDLTATVHLPKDTTSVKAIGKIPEN
jgi:hypothetical protein